MNSEQTVSQWEQQLNILLNNDTVDLTQSVTLDGFMQLANQYGFTGVDFSAREDFLTTNNFQVTRPNLRNSDLSCGGGDVAA